ncbi:hypothetical protein MPRS_38480 [Mycobacterium paraseoulense]|nr:hypothetical protein MPRS_38480 [Mycobacterium paraseoulense]
MDDALGAGEVADDVEPGHVVIREILVPIYHRLDCREQHPIPHGGRVMIWVCRKNRILNISDASTQELNFGFEYAGMPDGWRRDRLRNSRQTIATAHSFDQSWSEFVYLGRGRPRRSITAQHRSFGVRFADIRVVLVGSGADDGPQQVHRACISSARGWLEQRYVGWQFDVGRDPPGSEVGDQQSGAAVVPQSGSPRKSRLLSGHRIDEPLQALLFGRPTGYRAGGRACCRRRR